MPGGHIFHGDLVVAVRRGRRRLGRRDGRAEPAAVRERRAARRRGQRHRRPQRRPRSADALTPRVPRSSTVSPAFEHTELPSRAGSEPARNGDSVCLNGGLAGPGPVAGQFSCGLDLRESGVRERLPVGEVQRRHGLVAAVHLITNSAAPGRRARCRSRRTRCRRGPAATSGAGSSRTRSSSTSSASRAPAVIATPVGGDTVNRTQRAAGPETCPACEQAAQWRQPPGGRQRRGRVEEVARLTRVGLPVTERSATAGARKPFRYASHADRVAETGRVAVPEAPAARRPPVAGAQHVVDVRAHDDDHVHRVDQPGRARAAGTRTRTRSWCARPAHRRRRRRTDIVADTFGSTGSSVLPVGDHADQRLHLGLAAVAEQRLELPARVRREQVQVAARVVLDEHPGVEPARDQHVPHQRGGLPRPARR